MSQSNSSDKATLNSFLDRGNVTRRQFIERAAALGVTASAATTMWSQKAAATPKKGGTLRVGTEGGATTDSMDSQVTISTNHITLAQWSVYERLTYLDQNGAPQPQLAENWEASNGGKTWTFKLRDGVQFQNGKALTPQDVIYSFNYVGSEDSKAADPKKIMKSITGMRADGNAVVFDIAAPNADFPIVMASSGMLVAPEGLAGTDWDKPGNGTGPYILENIEAGVRISGTRNPNYYDDSQAHFDAFETLNIADPNSRTSALRAGDLDIISRPDPKTAKRLGDSSGIHLIAADGTQHYTMPMLTDTAPFDNNDVRLALKLLVKRDEYLSKILNGFGYVGNDVPIGRGQQYFNDQLPQREYDPDKAKFHLKQAGAENLKLKLSAADAAYTGAVDGAQLMSEWAKPAGVEIEVVREPSDGYWSDVWLKKPWSMAYWSGRPTVGQMISAGYTPDTAWNDAKWKNERVAELNRKAISELNDDRRRDMYFEIQKIIHEEGGTIIPVFAQFLHAASDKLGHGDFRGVRTFDNYAITRTGWFKA